MLALPRPSEEPVPTAARGWVENTVEPWIREGTYVSETSRRLYRQRAGLIPNYLEALGFAPPPTSVDAFRREHIEALRCRAVCVDARVQGRRMSPKHLSVVLSALHGLLAYWAERRPQKELGRLVADRRLWRVKDPRPVRPSRSLDSLEELARLMAAADDRTRVGISLGAGSGLRISEISALECRDLELALDRSSWLTVRSGKGSKPRRTPVPPASRNLLLAAVQGKGASDRVMEISASCFRSRLALAGARAGIGHVHPHRLRATFITFAIRSGAPEQTVQEWAGHRDAETTHGYSRGDPEIGRRALVLYERYLQGGAL